MLMSWVLQEIPGAGVVAQGISSFFIAVKSISPTLRQLQTADLCYFMQVWGVRSLEAACLYGVAPHHALGLGLVWGPCHLKSWLNLKDLLPGFSSHNTSCWVQFLTKDCLTDLMTCQMALPGPSDIRQSGRSWEFYGVATHVHFCSY